MACADFFLHRQLFSPRGVFLFQLFLHIFRQLGQKITKHENDRFSQKIGVGGFLRHRVLPEPSSTETTFFVRETILKCFVLQYIIIFTKQVEEVDISRSNIFSDPQRKLARQCANNY